MMEAVDALDSHEFCKYFYPAIFAKLRKIVESLKAGKDEYLEWVDVLYQPRLALRDRHQETGSREWALPLLYVQPHALSLRLAPAPPATLPATAEAEATEDESRAHEETIEGLLSMIPPDKIQEFLDAINEESRRV
jgi:hypothetical protein